MFYNIILVVQYRLVPMAQMISIGTAVQIEVSWVRIPPAPSLFFITMILFSLLSGWVLLEQWKRVALRFLQRLEILSFLFLHRLWSTRRPNNKTRDAIFRKLKQVITVLTREHVRIWPMADTLLTSLPFIIMLALLFLQFEILWNLTFFDLWPHSGRSHD